MTISFIIRQLDVCEDIIEQTGCIPLYSLINQVLIDEYEHEELLRKGQGLVSTQRRITKAIQDQFNYVDVCNEFVDVKKGWALPSYSVIDRSDVMSITNAIRGLL